MDDKSYEHLMDAMGEGSSNCCDARVYDPGDTGIGICMGCKEHCEVVKNEE